MPRRPETAELTALHTSAPAAVSHDWLGLLEHCQGPELDRGLERLARLAAAVHRGAAAPPRHEPESHHQHDAGHPTGGLRGHGRPATAVGRRPHGGSAATECDR